MGHNDGDILTWCFGGGSHDDDGVLMAFGHSPGDVAGLVGRHHVSGAHLWTSGRGHAWPGRCVGDCLHGAASA